MNEDYSELVISQSQLDDIFVVRYLQDLSREAVVVYLWLNMTSGGKEFDEETVKSYRVISESKIKETMAELLGAGLIASSGEKFVLEDLKRREVKDYVASCKAKGEAGDIPGLMSDPEEHKTLTASISKTFFLGRMDYNYYRLIDKCLYEYRFEGTVCYKLFEEGYQRGILRKYNAMAQVASHWFEKGYTTADRLEQYLERNSLKERLVKLCSKTMRKHLTDLDIARIHGWVDNLNANEELVAYAFRVNEFRNNLTLMNIETTLKKWFDLGIDTAEKAAKLNEEEHKENQRKSSLRKNRSGSKWKTGAEAGLTSSGSASETAEESSESKPAKPEKEQKASDNAKSKKDDGGIPDDILDMFGDSNEDD
ncbi:MAG: DnaD domain protein [Clostridiales bacterium]|nr:DnaD domain protein [Clostridiales bacterium]